MASVPGLIAKAALLLDKKRDVGRAVEVLREAVIASKDQSNDLCAIEARVFLIDVAISYSLADVDLSNLLAEVKVLVAEFSGDSDLVEPFIGRLRELNLQST